MGASRAGRANCDVNCAEYTSPNTYVAASHKIAHKNRARCPLYGSVQAKKQNIYTILPALNNSFNMCAIVCPMYGMEWCMAAHGSTIEHTMCVVYSRAQYQSSTACIILVYILVSSLFVLRQFNFCKQGNLFSVEPSSKWLRVRHSFGLSMLITQIFGGLAMWKWGANAMRWCDLGINVSYW